MAYDRLTAITPAPQITWTHAVRSFDSNVTNGHSVAIVATKNLFVDIGWSVVESADGSQKVTGDCWTTSLSATANGSWALLSNQDDTIQLLLNVNTGVGGYCEARWSPGCLFTGGTKNTRPTASDELAFYTTSMGINWNQPNCYLYGASGLLEGHYTTRVLLLINTYNIGRIMGGYWAFEYVVTDLTVGQWADNRICLWFQNLLQTNYMDRNDTDESGDPPFGGRNVSGQIVRVFDVRSETYGWVPSKVLGSLDSSYRASPMWIARGVYGQPVPQVLGYLPDMFWTASPSAWNEYYDVGDDWTQIHEVLFPRFATLTPFIKGTDRTSIKLLSPNSPGHVDAVADTTEPTVTIESPTPGTSISTSTTIIARVTDESGLRHAPVFVYYPDDPGLPWEVVYNSQGFEPLRYGTCTRSELIEDADYRYYIRRTGGWPSSPRLHFDPIDTGGNVIA